MRPERATALTAGEVLELTVEKAVYRGLALARHEGRVIFVPRAFPGERVRVRVASVERGFARAEIIEVQEPAPGRRAAPCAHAARCGGCAYQDLRYEDQLVLKRDILAETLRRAGAPYEGAFEVTASPETGWRTRATFHFEESGGALRLGLHEEGTRAVVDVERCLQLVPTLDDAARGLKQALVERPDLWPGLRALHLAAGHESGVVATVAVADPAADVARLLPLRAAVPGLTGFAALAGEEDDAAFVMLHGSPRLGHRVGDLRITSHARAFFQGNRFQVDGLVQAVVDLLPAEGPALDLYAGVGLLGLPLVARGQAVHAVEGDETAVDDARENARRLELSAFRIDRSDVRAALAVLPRTEPEQVVLDPPRSGAGLDVVELLAARRPRTIVYVSCDPPTLGRDLAHFARQGYRVDALRAFDMFPGTFHLETVARLVPAL
ncbi:MAG TPA: class I SAM-dependent RNA methyltransferase [Vicinamibacteria bacterium]|nr:class I SAM-dependent RNA methyltransferase [Vicinamibacteria bacterium]